jgi:hypothetical protein
MQMSQMLQLFTFQLSGVSQSATATNLVTPIAVAEAATIRRSPPLTEIIAVTSPPRPSPPPPLQQQVAATGAGPVGAGAQTPVNPYVDLPELPVPIFSTMNNALPTTFSSALLGGYQRNGHWRYKNIKGLRMD